MNAFAEWLDVEIAKHNWTRAELSRRSGISQSALSLIYSGQRKPGPDICEALARTLDLPAIIVYRQAGMMQRVPESTALDELMAYRLAELTPEQTREVMQFIDWILHRDRPRREGGADHGEDEIRY